MENSIFTLVLVAVSMLSIASLASVGLKKIGFPYTIGLVLIGGAMALLAEQVPGLALLKEIKLSPEIILYLILPTLIFDAALGIDARLLLRNLVPISLLASIGVLLSTVLVGFGLAWLSPLPLAGALLFGALISATDPVAVIALFKEIGAPRRLVTLIDGESVFNDATAIVLFGIIFATVTAAGAPPAIAESVGWGGLQFCLVLLGGVAVGAGIGLLGSFASLLDRSSLVFQKIVSLLIAYASFIVADHVFHFSGVMAVLAAGLVMRYRAETSTSLSVIENIEHAWGFFAFVANSFVFMLLGLTEVDALLRQGTIVEDLLMVALSIPLVLLGRVACVWLLIPPYNFFRRRLGRDPVPGSYQAVLFWGGLRGAIPVALVLAIPLDFPHRDTILHLTMGNILFTLLVQGTTVKWLMDRLGVKPEKSEFDDRVTVEEEFKLPNPGYARLVLNQIRETMERQGFQSREKPGEDGQAAWLYRHGPRLIGFRQATGSLVLTCEETELSFMRDIFDRATEELNTHFIMEQSRTASAAPLFLADLLTPDHVRLGLSGADEAAVIQELLGQLSSALPGAETPELLAEVLNREQQFPTAWGNGIAAPHAKSARIKEPLLAIGIHPEGLDWKAADGEPVHVICLILTPAKHENEHLDILAQLARVLSRNGIRESLLAAADAEAVIELFEQALPNRG